MPDLAPPILGKDLPPLGWHGATPLDHAVFEPVERVGSGDHLAGWSKPPGGLWTSPIEVHGGISLTIWVAAHGERHLGGTHCGLVWEVLPSDDAPFWQIDTVDDLSAAIDRYPDPANARPDDPTRWYLDRCDLIDYPAMAKDYAGIYLSARGANKLNRPDFSRPKGIKAPPRAGRYLWAWDVPTVLFLQPAFTVGKAHPVTDDVVKAWDTARDADFEADAILMRQELLDACAAGGVTLPEDALALPPLAFIMAVGEHMRRAGLD